MTSSYLTFARAREREAGRKTQVWLVCSLRSGAKLGEIRWFGRWRQYAFWPEPETIFNTECLAEIAEFAASLTERHRRAA